MKCIKCEKKLRVTHTYDCATRKFQRAVCPSGHVHTLTTTSMVSFSRGFGAKAAAKEYKSCEESCSP